MQITGHKTESVYRRYDIVDSADVKMAGKMLEAYMSSQTPARNRTLGPLDSHDIQTQERPR